MKSPGNFLIIDPEMTKLLQILAKLHPYGNKRVLKVLLKFYIKIAKHAHTKNLDPLIVLEEIAETHLAGDYAGFELKKIKRIDDMMEDVEGSKVPLQPSYAANDMAELKTLIRELRTAARPLPEGAGTQLPETFSPKEAAKLVKVRPSKSPKKSAQDYREIRKKTSPRKIVF